jgi:hypothetical protein
MSCTNPKCVEKRPHAAGDACRYDGAEVLGSVSGLGREAVLGIWAKVKDNHARLDACPGPHDFRRISERPTIGPAYSCAKCGGTVSTSDQKWYERGLKHGRSS